jgi:hypothetical protein
MRHCIEAHVRFGLSRAGLPLKERSNRDLSRRPCRSQRSRLRCSRSRVPSNRDNRRHRWTCRSPSNPCGTRDPQQHPRNRRPRCPRSRSRRRRWRRLRRGRSGPNQRRSRRQLRHRSAAPRSLMSWHHRMRSPHPLCLQFRPRPPRRSTRGRSRWSRLRRHWQRHQPTAPCLNDLLGCFLSLRVREHTRSPERHHRAPTR